MRILDDPHLILSKEKSIRIYNFDSKEMVKMVKEHRFKQEIYDVQKSPIDGFLMVLCVNRRKKQTSLHAINMKSTSGDTQKIASFNTYKIYEEKVLYETMYLASEFFILVSSLGFIKRVNFRDSLDYSFYEHVSDLNTLKDVNFSEIEGRKVVFPEILTTAHFYAEYGATKAL